MLWPPLITGTLIRRYKRFKADVLLHSTSNVVCAYCPNTGSMKGCARPGRTVYLSRSSNPNRKLPYTWEMIDLEKTLVGINTGLTNSIVLEGIQQEIIPELAGYSAIRREVVTSPGSRIDMVLDGPQKCFMEIKNCTLVEARTAFFPDAVTVRGQKHLNELIRLRKEGHRAVILYLIQRMDAEMFLPAEHIDPEYGRLMARARSVGVEVLAYDVLIDECQVRVNKSIECPL